MKKIVFWFFVGVFMSVGLTAFAVPSSVDRITDHIEPLVKTDYVKGTHFVASSALSTSTFAGGVGIGTTTPFRTFSVTGRGVVTQSFSVGSSTRAFDPLRNITDFQCDQNTYCVFNFGNNSNGTAASADIVFTNDLSTDTTYYSDIGCNSSTYTEATYAAFNDPNGCYWYNTDGPLTLATATTTASKSYISLVTGGVNDAAERVRITAAGNVGIANAAPFYRLTVGTPTTPTTASFTPTNRLVVTTTENLPIIGVNTTTSSSVQGAIIGLYSSDGTAMSSGDRLGGFLFGGTSSVGDLRNSAAVIAYANQNWANGSAYGTRLGFETIANGSTSRTEKITVTDGGRLGIATTTPDNLLGIFSTTKADIGFSGKFTLGYDGTNARFAIASSTALGTNDVFVIDGSGDVGVATTSPWRKFSVDGTVSLANLTAATGGTNQDLCITTANDVVNETTGTCIVSSRKVKHDIRDLAVSGIELIKKLTPRIFKRNGEDVDRYGFIAEEVAEVDSQLATYGTDGEPRGLDDHALIATLVQSVKEQQEQIDKLRRQVEQKLSFKQCKL